MMKWELSYLEQKVTYFNLTYFNLYDANMQCIDVDLVFICIQITGYLPLHLLCWLSSTFFVFGSHTE